MLTARALALPTLLVALSSMVPACGSGGATTDPGGGGGGGGGGSSRDSGTPGHDSGASDAASGADMGTGGSDAGDDAAPAACDPVTQTGCTSTQKCALGPQPICAANGTQAAGAVCGAGGSDDCVRGAACVGDSTGTVRLCHQFCTTDANCTQPAVAAGGTAEANNVGRCVEQLSGASYKVCTSPCNPVAAAGASGCPVPLGCSYGLVTTTGPEITNCQSVGAGVDGTSCTTSSDCNAGFTCVGTSAAALHCRSVCRAGTPADCGTSGYQCAPPSGVTSPMFGFCCPTGGC